MKNRREQNKEMKTGATGTKIGMRGKKTYEGRMAGKKRDCLF